MRLVSLAVGLALVAGTAMADVKPETFKAETVASMYRLCSADETTTAGKYAVGFCYGWIEGVGQFYEELLIDKRFNLKATVCTDPDLTREEVRETFVNWADANPDSGSRPALDGIVRAMKENYPCK